VVDEGVIKFSAAHTYQALPAHRFGELACRLNSWRRLLSQVQVIGQTPERYAGIGFGNVSGRAGLLTAGRGERGFLISGTQTGGLADLALEQFCLVRSYDYGNNTVISEGLAQPSSEAMTHGAIYDLGPQIRFVLHGHSPLLWQRASALRIPLTAAHVAYGTPEMAYEVHRLFRCSSLSEVQILAMGGHEDGVIVFGRTAEEAGLVLMRYLARAYEDRCTAERESAPLH
jgi:hypothetical protein